MKRIGVGIMGIGWVAGAHATAMLENPNYEIKALVSRRKESCGALKKEHDSFLLETKAFIS